jgi:hypothetical protein
MAQQKYVRLNVALTVNGISCSISEDMFTTFLEQIITYKQYRHRIRKGRLFPEGILEDLSPNMLAEIVHSRQVEHRKAIAGNPDITKDAVATLLQDEQVEVVRELTENKHALKLMKGREIYDIAQNTTDAIILRNLASIFNVNGDLAKDLSEHTPLIELLSKNPDIEVRKHIAEYLSIQRIEAEQHDEYLDAEMVSMVNKSTDSMRQDRKGES